MIIRPLPTTDHELVLTKSKEDLYLETKIKTRGRQPWYVMYVWYAHLYRPIARERVKLRQRSKGNEIKTPSNQTQQNASKTNICIDRYSGVT